MTMLDELVRLLARENRNDDLDMLWRVVVGAPESPIKRQMVLTVVLGGMTILAHKDEWEQRHKNLYADRPEKLPCEWEVPE